MKLEEIKLGIGIPCGFGFVHIRFATSLVGLKLVPDTRLMVVEKTMIHTARNDMVKEMIENRDYIFFLDDDMILEPDSIHRLLAHEKEIVGGLAFKRREPYSPCIYKKIGKKYYPMIPQTTKLMEVDVIGLAGTLVKTEVFKKLPEPWFYFDRSFSEDFHFSINARKAGFKIYCDPTVALEHIGDCQIVNWQTFLDYKRKSAEPKVESK